MDFSQQSLVSGYSTKYCSYPNCSNKYLIVKNFNFKNKSFFKPPLNSDINLSWRSICDIKSSVKTFYICEDHFLSSDFIYNKRRPLLKKGTVPVPLLQEISTVLSTSISTVNVQVSEIPSSSFSHSHSNNSNNLNKSIIHSNVLLKSSDTLSNDSTVPIFHFNSSISHVTENSLCDKSTNIDIIKDFISKQNSNILSDHSYCKSLSSVCDKTTNSKNNTEKNSLLYKMHRNALSKISKLKARCRKQKSDISNLRNIFKNGKLEEVCSNLNLVTRNFIASQLRNSSRKSNCKIWSLDDKTFALSMYKRSGKLYRYLQTHFSLSSISTLKSLLSKIEFESGINKLYFEHLKSVSSELNDKNCCLLFDEVSLSSGIHFQVKKQEFCGFKDYGHLGKTSKKADHALVFMIRGLSSNWKEVVAYYFSKGTVPTLNLKLIITEIISNLQSIGLNHELNDLIRVLTYIMSKGMGLSHGGFKETIQVKSMLENF
ncbi:uncharacterized protein LOC126266401 [Aethina tumida]|uniref:uncharacterized protein LOC126266401 n=1 Tax=Aethina tumida TaxID=116153 RepID=UPI00214933FA|nr:uncharacterized protein LOC126266401 [Aethina tumida]